MECEMDNDITPPTARGVSEVLEAAADLLTPEEAWTQGAYARDEFGNDINPEERWEAVVGAKCWCLYGALAQVGLPVVDASWAFDPSVELGLPDTDWNDAPERTQAEVVAALRSAATLARETEAGL